MKINVNKISWTVLKLQVIPGFMSAKLAPDLLSVYEYVSNKKYFTISICTKRADSSQGDSRELMAYL